MPKAGAYGHFFELCGYAVVASIDFWLTLSCGTDSEVPKNDAGVLSQP